MSKVTSRATIASLSLSQLPLCSVSTVDFTLHGMALSLKCVKCVNAW